MKFNNKPNILYSINTEYDDNIQVWDSRSVAVNGVILIDVANNEDSSLYVLVNKRGPYGDFPDLWNLPAGYLDKNETGPEAFVRETWEECGLNLYKLQEDALMINERHLDQPWNVETDPSVNRQNISLRYGLYTTQYYFPSLSTDYNDIPGEVIDPRWIPVNIIDKYEWAFNHDRVIKNYLLKINKTKAL